MKKCLFLISLCCLLLLTACDGGPEVGEPYDGDVNTYEGVTMTVDKASHGAAAVTVVNTTDKEINSGNEHDFGLQVLRDGVWHWLETKGGSANTSEAWIFDQDQPRSFTCDWTRRYGSLPDGTYRLTKWFFEYDPGLDHTDFLLTAEFTLGEEQPAPEATAEPASTAPPRLTVRYNEAAMEVLKGGYSWTWQNPDGTTSATLADSAHPLQMQDLMTPLYLLPSTLSHVDPLAAYLEFDRVPDRVTARSWTADCWDDPDAPSEAANVQILMVDHSGPAIPPTIRLELSEEDRIYEVFAEWNGEDSGGTCSYCFYVEWPDLEATPAE